MISKTDMMKNFQYQNHQKFLYVLILKSAEDFLFT